MSQSVAATLSAKERDEKIALSKTLAKGVLMSLMCQKDPVAALEALDKNADSFVKTIFPRKDSAYDSYFHMLKGYAMAASSSALFWAGFVLTGHLLIPAISTIVGGMGVVRIFKGVYGLSDVRQRFEFFKAYYICLRIMERADKVTTDQEKKEIQALLAALPISMKERDELEKLAPHTINDVVFPTWFALEQKKSLLQGAWSVLYCDGLTSEETVVFDQLAGKCGFSGPELEAIKTDSQKAMDEQDQLLGWIGAISSFLLPKEAMPPALEVLLEMAVKRESEKELRLVIEKSLDADRQGESEILKTEYSMAIVSSAYFLCRALEDREAGVMKTVSGKYDELCQAMGKENESVRFKATVEKVYMHLFDELHKRFHSNREDIA